MSIYFYTHELRCHINVACAAESLPLRIRSKSTITQFNWNPYADIFVTEPGFVSITTVLNNCIFSVLLDLKIVRLYD